MDNGIGAILRETRSRRKIELSEVEATIKIRVRYLTAMENEDWKALPGGPYTAGFIRAYASYLGLDGDRLADEYRRGVAAPSGIQREAEQGPSPLAPSRSSVSGRALAALAVGLLLAAAAVVGLLGRVGERSPEPAAKSGGHAPRHTEGPLQPIRSPGTEIRLTATGEVWVCLLNGAQEPLIDGRILETGAEEGPFRSNRFSLSLGNGGVALEVDGKDMKVPETGSPIGYLIAGHGKLRTLSETERPTCT